MTLLPSAPQTITAAPRVTAPSTLAPPRSDPAMIATGKNVFAARCARCHRLPRPAEHTPAQWAQIVPKMAKRSGLKPDQQQAVLAYLSSVAPK